MAGQQSNTSGYHFIDPAKFRFGQ